VLEENAPSIPPAGSRLPCPRSRGARGPVPLHKCLLVLFLHRRRRLLRCVVPHRRRVRTTHFLGKGGNNPPAPHPPAVIFPLPSSFIEIHEFSGPIPTHPLDRRAAEGDRWSGGADGRGLRPALRDSVRWLFAVVRDHHPGCAGIVR